MRKWTQAAPVPWPISVTLLESPPKLRMFSWTQWSAAIWSKMPRLEGFCRPSLELEFRKPIRKKKNWIWPSPTRFLNINEIYWHRFFMNVPIFILPCTLVVLLLFICKLLGSLESIRALHEKWWVEKPLMRECSIIKLPLSFWGYWKIGRRPTRHLKSSGFFHLLISKMRSMPSQICHRFFRAAIGKKKELYSVFCLRIFSMLPISRDLLEYPWVGSPKKDLPSSGAL